MKSFLKMILLSIPFLSCARAAEIPPTTRSYKSIYEVPLKSIDGEETTLNQFQGKVLIVVNTASKCGFTSQYEGLEKLYESHKEQGAVVLGFPSNDFMNQEPGDNAEVKRFCKLNYGVTFPLFAKGAVTGAEMQEFYRYLLTTAPAEMKGGISWNFEKFLIDRKGQIRYRFGSFTKPTSTKFIEAVEQLLAER
jgi:glutathione peroxidase